MSDSLFDPTISVINKALDGSALRQKVIADNIANVNTPNYKSKSVVFEEELKAAISDKGDVKDSDGLDESAIEDIKPSVMENRSTSLRTDQNNVDIDGEMSRLAENQLYYAALSRLIDKKFRILQQAISEGKR